MEERSVDIPPTGGRNERSGNAGGGDIRLPPPEHGRTVHCYQAHYGPVHGGRAETGANDILSVVSFVTGGTTSMWN